MQIAQHLKLTQSPIAGKSAKLKDDNEAVT